MCDATVTFTFTQELRSYDLYELYSMRKQDYVRDSRTAAASARLPLPRLPSLLALASRLGE
jgi:hypothetical protein